LTAPLAFSVLSEALPSVALLAADFEAAFDFALEVDFGFDREAAFGFFGLDLERAFDPFPFDRLCGPLP